MLRCTVLGFCLMSQFEAKRLDSDLMETLHTASDALIATRGGGEAGTQAVPEDYWQETKTLDRCRGSFLNRVVKAVVGIPLGFVVTYPFAIISGWTGFIMLAVLYDSFYLVQAAGFAFYLLMTAPVPLAMIGAQQTVDFSLDKLAGLLGMGEHHPACCCKEGHCALVGSSKEAKWAICPPDGWEHDATQCAAPEVIMYESETLEHCHCVTPQECQTNKLYRGHAWCEASGTSGEAKCGRRYHLDRKKKRSGARWDFCRIAGSGVTLEDGSSTSNNSALATFVPNVYRSLRLPAGNPWTLGTYADGRRGIVSARPKRDDSLPECFAGLPEETLDGCAQRCLLEGAPNARTMERGRKAYTSSYECVAIAYNRRKRLCVRLPEFAKDAKFTPVIRNLTRSGWQSFVFEEFAKDANSRP